MELDETQIVGVQGDSIVILTPKVKMTCHEALSLAAKLVVLADQKDEFGEYLEAAKA